MTDARDGEDEDDGEGTPGQDSPAEHELCTIHLTSEGTLRHSLAGPTNIDSDENVRNWTRRIHALAAADYIRHAAKMCQADWRDVWREVEQELYQPTATPRSQRTS